MAKRKARQKQNSKLRYDSQLSILQSGDEQLDQLSVLDLAERQRQRHASPMGPLCCCPPPGKDRLGGCQPALTWANPEHTAFKAICRTCLRPLVPGMHNRRDQRHMLNLSQMAMDHIDLQGLEEVGLFVELITPSETGNAVAVTPLAP